MNKADAEAYLRDKEETVLRPTPPNRWPVSSSGGLGIEVSWRRGRKRDGCILRRGQQYGFLEYRIMHGYGNFQTATREEAIAELEKPIELRQAMRLLEDIAICALCKKTALGRENRRHWHSIRYEKPTGLMRIWRNSDGQEILREPICNVIWFELCDDCIAQIAEKCGL